MNTVNNDLLDEMTRELVAEFRPEQVILFGSHAWGDPDKHSDVDLLVIVGNSDLSDYERAVLALTCLSEIDVPKDVIVRTRAEFDFFRDVKASLENKIARHGKILYDRSQETVGSNLAH